MTKNVRSGLALIAVAIACLLVYFAASPDIANVALMAAFLFGLGGLVLTAVGLARQD